MPRFTLGAIALLVSATVVYGADKASEAFITKAIEGNFAEVEMGKLAQSNGQSDAVKSYGQMLVADHSAANDKAMQAAKSLGVTPPRGPSKKQQADHDKMAKMKGAAFDKMFAQDMVKDHKNDIAEYNKESSKNDDAGSYAKNSLPVLQKHLEAAQALEKAK
jgi:putative membrane protein